MASPAAQEEQAEQGVTPPLGSSGAAGTRESVSASDKSGDLQSSAPS